MHRLWATTITSTEATEATEATYLLLSTRKKTSACVHRFKCNKPDARLLMQTTRRQIVSNATPFIARDSPRKLTSTQIAQISDLVKNPQMMNPNPSGMNPNLWGRREANTHTWLVTSSPSEEELEDWSLQETMAERRKAASRQWRRRRWSGSRERRARVMN